MVERLNRAPGERDVTSSTHQKELLLRYLLHEMNSSERETVDMQLIADPEYAADFQSTQNDLLDDFAADRLRQEESARVQRAIESNSSFARAAQMANAFRLANWHPRPTTKQVPRFHLPYWAVAACGVMIAGGLAGSVLWLHRPSAPLAQLKATPGATQAAQPIQPKTIQAGAIAPPQSQVRSPRPLLVATLVLPESTRSEAATQLELKPGVQSIHIEWAVATEAESSPRLALTILQDSKRIARFAEESPRRTIAGTPVARFIVPPALVQPGKYLFRITGFGDDPSQIPLLESAVEVTLGE
jgi:hypothetical protein